jgi:hypothetical protein
MRQSVGSLSYGLCWRKTMTNEDDAMILRERASQCRRLAMGQNDRQRREDLLVRARQFDAEAAQIELTAEAAAMRRTLATHR